MTDFGGWCTFFIITTMLGTPSLVRDDRIKVEKRCLDVFCFDENFATPARVCSQRGERTEKRARAK